MQVLLESAATMKFCWWRLVVLLIVLATARSAMAATLSLGWRSTGGDFQNGRQLDTSNNVPAEWRFHDH